MIEKMYTRVACSELPAFRRGPRRIAVHPRELRERERGEQVKRALRHHHVVCERYDPTACELVNRRTFDVQLSKLLSRFPQ